MRLSKRILIVITLLFVTLFLFLLSYKESRPSEFTAYRHMPLVIGHTTYTAYIADTPQLRERGLSGKSRLPVLSGMLFIFDFPGIYAFWMKDMQMSLDFVFIKGDRVVDILENIAPATYPESFVGNSPYDKVFEISAGSIKKYKIRIGDTVEFLN